MPFGIPSFRGVLKWPPSTTVVIAASGLAIAVVAVTHRIWRGGGKKAIDPDGKNLDIEPEEKNYSESKRTVWNVTCDNKADTSLENLGSACDASKETEETEVRFICFPEKEPERSNGVVPPEILKVEEIVHEKVIPESQTVLDVSCEKTADALVEKPDIVCESSNGTVPLEALKVEEIEHGVNPQIPTVLNLTTENKVGSSEKNPVSVCGTVRAEVRSIDSPKEHNTSNETLPLKTLKFGEIIEQEKNPESQSDLDVTSESKGYTFEEKPESATPILEETVRAEVQFTVFTENSSSQPVCVKEAESEVTAIEKPDSSTLMTLVQSVVPGLKPEGQEVEVISVDELIVSADRLPSQCDKVVIDKTKEATPLKPIELIEFHTDKVQEVVVTEIPSGKGDSNVKKLMSSCKDSDCNSKVKPKDCPSPCEIIDDTVKLDYLEDAGSKTSVETQFKESYIDNQVQLAEPAFNAVSLTEDNCSVSFQNTQSSENSHLIQNIPYTLSGCSGTADKHPHGIDSNSPKTKGSLVLSGVEKGKEVLELIVAGDILDDCSKEPNKEVNEQKAGIVSDIRRDLKEGHTEVSETGSSALGDKEKQEVLVETDCDRVTKMKSEEVEVFPSDGLGGLKNNEVKLIPLERKSMFMEESGMSPKGKSGKRKGKKQKKILKEQEVLNKLDNVESKTIVGLKEESLEMAHSIEENSGKSSQGHASGINSPSLPNFPDNRSEGSSCGDSGKGRSDVTTPGGLEEELREVSFSNHYSPPCSTSGPEEEDEDRVRRASGSTAEDGSRGELGSAIGGEEIVGNSPVPLGSDGLVMPVALPIYPGMVPPHTPPPSVYEFVIPQGLVGRLIGKHGSFVNLIKARTSATIFIKTHPETNKLKVCAIEGTEDEIQAALEMIREKFPLRRYSSMTLEQVFFLPLPPPTFTLIPDSLPLQLVEGVSNDVILSALVSPSHYFLQQPTHPTYPTLAKQDMWMAMSYQDTNAPMLPEDIKAGIICAAPTMGGWYRAQIVAVEELTSPPEDESTEEGELIKWCDVRFVDYGGYERLPAHSLRQIRSDFMTLPFQASECYLASVVPAAATDRNEVTDVWSEAAYALVEELTQAQVLKAQVVGHAADGLPLVLLYAYSHTLGQVVQVNEELVNRGLALWAMPVLEPDQVFLTNGSDIVSGEENRAETEAEVIAA